MHNTLTRKTIFYIFITLFILSAPAIVLYTAGFRWSRTHGLTRTGTMFIASVPKDATIFLNNKEESDHTPAVLTRKTPGDYDVRLELEDHMTWEKRMTINEGVTTFIDNVILFANGDPSLYIAEDMETVSWSPDKESIAWANHQAGWTEVWVSKINRPASRLISRLPLTEHIELSWLTNDVVSITVNDTTTLVRTDGTTENLKISNHFNAKVVPFNETIRVVETSSTRVIATLPNGTYNIIDERGQYILLQDTKHNKIALLNKQDEQEPLLLFEDATSAEWINQDVLLFSTPFSISIYEPSQHQTKIITRISDVIYTPQWHPDGKYIFYSTNHELRAIELDDRDGRNVTILATMESIRSFSVDPKGRRIYITGSDGIDTGLFRRELYRR